MKRRLAIGGRIDRYVGLLFVSSYFAAFLMVVGLFLVVDMSGRLDEFLTPGADGASPPTSWIVRFYALGLPFIYLEVAPFVTLLAALFTVTKLLKHSEATAVLNAGVSSHRLLLPVFVGAGLVALGMVGLREWAAASLGHERFLLEDRLTERRAEPVLESVFLKDGQSNPVWIDRFHLGEADGQGAYAVGLAAVLRDRGRWVNIEAERAAYVVGAGGSPGSWRLLRGMREDIDDQERPPVSIALLDEVAFTPHDVLVAHKAAERPLELSSREIHELQTRDPDNVQWRTLDYHLLTFPLANLVLLLVALPFVMRFGRGRGRGAEGVAAGFLLCIFYFGADFISRSMGMQGALSPLMATWLPLVFFGSLGAVLFSGLQS